MRATDVRADPLVVPIFDRALTDLLRSHRMVEDTERRLGEALAILRTLGGPAPLLAAERSSWISRLEDAVSQLTIVRATLRDILSEERPSSRSVKDPFPQREDRREVAIR